MRVIIESRIHTDYDETRTKRQLEKMVNVILYAKDRKQLEEILNDFNVRDGMFYLEWGFGGNHFWVKQKGYENRVLITEF